MPILIVPKVDLRVLELNTNAGAVYIESARGTGGDPYVRKARVMASCYPLTLLSEHPDGRLTADTHDRDTEKLRQDLSTVRSALAQGTVVLVPAPELTNAMDSLEQTNPKLARSVNNLLWGDL